MSCSQLPISSRNNSITIHNSQALETTQMPTTGEWIKKMWYIYTMEFYSAIKNNGMWAEGKWMQLKDTC
jgi:hypothetical protein